MQASCSLQSELRTVFLRLAPPRGFAALCTVHCSTCVALDIKAMMTWRHPHLPPTYRWRSPDSSQLNDGKTGQGLRSLRDLTQHLTTRADDSHAAPRQYSLAGYPYFYER